MKRVLFLVVLLSVPVLGFSAATLDTQACSARAAGFTSHTVTLTVANNTNRALVVLIGAGNATNGVVSSVTGAGATWAGSAAGSGNGNNGYLGTVWAGTTPSTGSQTVTVNFAGTTDNPIAICVYSIYNVSQSGPVAHFGSAASGDLVITSASGNLAISAQFDDFNMRSVSGCTSSTDTSNYTSTGFSDANCAGAATDTFTWAGYGTHSVAVGVDVVAIATGITHDSDYNSGNPALTTGSAFTITGMACGGTNRLVLVGVCALSVAGLEVTQVKAANDAAMTKLGEARSVTGAVYATLFQGIAPSTGSQTVTISLSGNAIAAAGATCFSSVQQTSPTEGENDTSATNVGAADAIAPVVTVADNDFVFGVVATDDATITPSLTSAWNVTAAAGSCSGEYAGPKTPAGSYNVGWTAVAGLATWSVDAVALRLNTDAALPTKNKRSLLKGVK